MIFQLHPAWWGAVFLRVLLQFQSIKNAKISFSGSSVLAILQVDGYNMADMFSGGSRYGGYWNERAI